MDSEWQTFFKQQKKTAYFKELELFIEQEYATKEIYPSKDDIFNAFEYTSLNDVKVVIIGQDPYHDVGQAHGLCFSVPTNIACPPSLVNIFKELKNDIGCEVPLSGNLEQWSKQGVFLMNTVLTVEAHSPNSHKGKGWEKFTDEVIKLINEQDRPIVFLLWGKPAQSKKKLLSNKKHLIIESSHPSPLSSYRGFLGSRPFSQVNHFLQKNNCKVINWELKDI